MKARLRKIVQNKRNQQAAEYAAKKKQKASDEKEIDAIRKELDKLGVKYIHNTGLKKLKEKLKTFKEQKKKDK